MAISTTVNEGDNQIAPPRIGQPATGSEQPAPRFADHARSVSLAELAGSMPYDEEWRHIIEEVYRLRDEEKSAEFPE